jgi:small subunit ribosomal protein S6
MRTYEIMYIIRPTLGEDEIKKVMKDFENILTSNGAKVISTNDMGQRE